MAPDSPQPVSAEHLRTAKRHAKERLLAVDGVRGVGVGEGTVRVYVRHADVAAGLPDDIDEVPVECVVVDEASAY